FFKKEFASSVFCDAHSNEEALLDSPFNNREVTLEFFQTVHDIDPILQPQLQRLIALLDREGHNSFLVDEYLVSLLNYLIEVHQSDSRLSRKVNAIKSTTRTEVYKRLCFAKDFLHSYYM